MDDAHSANPTDAVPFAHAARFVSVDPTTNRSRVSELRLQATLWGA